MLDDSDEAEQVYDKLTSDVTVYPERGARLPTRRAYVMHTHSYDRFPALRCFYWFDDECVYLLYIEHYDELLPAHAVSRNSASGFFRSM